MNDISKDNFLEGKILPPLIKFAIPLMMSLFLQSLYGAVDLVVVGQFGSPASMSAVATGGQLMVAVTSIVTGLTMGITILIGQAVGSGKPENANYVVCAMVKLFSSLRCLSSFPLRLQNCSKRRIKPLNRLLCIFVFAVAE